MSLTYCMARAPSMVGGLAVSAGKESFKTDGSAGEAGAGPCALTAVASFSRSHAIEAITKASRQVPRKILLVTLGTANRGILARDSAIFMSPFSLCAHAAASDEPSMRCQC